MGNSIAGAGDEFIAGRDDRFLQERRKELMEENSDKDGHTVDGILQEELLLVPKADLPLEPIKCSLLVPTKDDKLWVQGTATFDIIYFSFQADLPVFGHLVQEKKSYYDILDVCKVKKTMISIKYETGPKKKQDELVLDLKSGKAVAGCLARIKLLVARVGQNSDLVVTEHERLHSAGILGPYQDPTEELKLARARESKTRQMAHLLTYKDWEALLWAGSWRVYQRGEVVLGPGDALDRLMHVAQGGVRILDAEPARGGRAGGRGARPAADAAAAAAASGPAAPGRQKAPSVEEDEVMDWVKESLKRNKDMGQNHNNDDDESTGGERGAELSAYSSSESEHSEDQELENNNGTDEFGEESLGSQRTALGSLRKDDIFGVMPFLCHWNPKGIIPKNGLEFEVTQPHTVIFSLNADILKNDILKSKKQVTAAWFKYLALILRERVQIAEDGLFRQKLHDFSQAIIRREEDFLEEKRKAEELPSADQENTRGRPLASIQDLFGFDATEDLHEVYYGVKLFTSAEVKGSKRQKLKLRGTLYLTDNYVAFFGSQAALNPLKKSHFRVVIPYEEVVNVHTSNPKTVIILDQMREIKQVEMRSVRIQENLMQKLMQMWRQEDIETGAQDREELRHRLTAQIQASLGLLESSTQETASSILQELTDSEKRFLFVGTVPMSLHRNEIIIQENVSTPKKAIYLLQSGAIRTQRLMEHVRGNAGTGRVVQKVVFGEVEAGCLFGFDEFLSGDPSASSYLVDSDQAIVRACPTAQSVDLTKEHDQWPLKDYGGLNEDVSVELMDKLQQDKKLASKFYRIVAATYALKLMEISPLDVCF